MSSGSARRTGYVRSRDLPRLLGLWPEEVARMAETDLEVVVARLASAIRAERRRGRSRHWSYDLNRHSALIHAFESECAALRRRQRQRSFASLAKRVTGGAAVESRETLE